MNEFIFGLEIKIQEYHQPYLFIIKTWLSFLMEENKCSVVPEQVLRGVGDGCSGGCSSTHVSDLLQSIEGILLVLMVRQAKFQPLIVGELHRTWTSNTQSVSQSAQSIH